MMSPPTLRISNPAVEEMVIRRELGVSDARHAGIRVSRDPCAPIKNAREYVRRLRRHRLAMELDKLVLVESCSVTEAARTAHCGRTLAVELLRWSRGK